MKSWIPACAGMTKEVLNTIKANFKNIQGLNAQRVMYKLSAKLLVGFFALLIHVTAFAGSNVEAVKAVEGSAKADKLDACVKPTPFMRRSHFELIKHQRDITVHQGIRETNDSLAGCVDCHAAKDAQGNFVPVNASGQFCAGCHEYTAATLDCFSCHAAKPKPTKAGN